MKHTSRLFLAAFLVGASLAPAARAAVQVEPAAVAAPEVSSGAAQEDALYAKGNKAMDEQRWTDAVTAFDGAAAAKGKRADAALYWKAYSLEKLGRKEESRATCNALNKEQPTSSWNRECIVLRARSTVDVEKLTKLAMESGKLNSDMSHLYIDNGKFYAFDTLKRSDRPTTEDDIKILALNSLMRQDPAKALPLLRDLLRSDKPIAMRRQALFVLSRSKEPEAQTILTEVATAKRDPELQREAIQILAINRGKDAGPTLVEIYRGASDAGVKRAALNGLFLAHDAPRLVDLARGEKDLNMKRDIVSQLALMKDPAATDYMLELLK